MYLGIDRKVVPEKHMSFFENDKYAVFWERLIFAKGIPSGQESVKTFISKISSDGIREACQGFSGNYCCVVSDKSEKKHYAFIDSDGLAQLFTMIAIYRVLLTAIEKKLS